MLKPYYRYQIDFRSKWIRWSMFSMAISFFFFMVYTFGISNLSDSNFFKAIFVMLLPTALSACYVFLMKIKGLNAPGIYGLIGVGFFLSALFGTFFSGSVIRVILGIVWYPVCGIIYLSCVGGKLPTVTPAACMIGVTVFAHLLFLLSAGFQLDVLALEIALIFAFAALLFLPYTFKQGRMKSES